LKEITSGLSIHTSERFWFKKGVESNIAGRCPAHASQRDGVYYDRYICQILIHLGNHLNSQVDNIYRV